MLVSRQIPVLLPIVVIFLRNFRLEERACRVSLICEMLHPWHLHVGGGDWVASLGHAILIFDKDMVSFLLQFSQKLSFSKYFLKHQMMYLELC